MERGIRKVSVRSGTDLIQMNKKLRDKIVNKKAKVGVIGLGYVGLPLAVLFAQKGFSCNAQASGSLTFIAVDFLKGFKDHHLFSFLKR